MKNCSVTVSSGKSTLSVKHTPAVPQSTLCKGSRKAKLGTVPADKKFSIHLSAKLNDISEKETLLEIPGAVEVWVCNKTENSGNQNYENFCAPDGSCPVLEARIFISSKEHPDWKEMTIGIPVSCLSKTEEIKNIQLKYTGTRWVINADGIEDEEFPFGDITWGTDTTWSIKSERVVSASFFPGCCSAEDKQPHDSKPVDRIQYFTPDGHNRWVGDVVLISFKGRLHIFYLIDRRHHQSKFGMGGHYFAHLSSPNLIDWFEHPPAVDIDEQWQSLGTGTPFVFEDKLHLAYGIHTTRMIPREKTLLPAMDAYLKENGRSGVFKAAEHEGIPAGATYATCEDGINFKRSDTFIHPTENPTIYTIHDGKLRLYCGYGVNGMWTADSLPGEFTCVDNTFPPKSIMEPCTDCPCVFNWNGRQYLIQGFSGFWSRPSNGGEYTDLAAEGRDIYEGLGVPMVAEYGDNRRIMAGWLGGLGWGGHLVIRELVQLEDGSAGLKWLPEVIPQQWIENKLKGTLKSGACRIMLNAPDSGTFLMELEVSGELIKGQSVFALQLLNDEDKTCSELQIDIAGGRAQWNDAVAGTLSSSIPSAREIIEAKRAGEAWAQPGRGHANFHSSGRNFCIEKVGGMQQPFIVRVIVFYDQKIGGSVVDAEIAGRRTLVSCRPGLRVQRIASIIK
ncbi:MAG: hypothetical protein GX804_02835 [Lentisphaerae bacterium]|jgi:hypothetical protein|nr:hypothetical protein [Lentisphaerota bacterium]